MNKGDDRWAAYMQDATTNTVACGHTAKEHAEIVRELMANREPKLAAALEAQLAAEQEK